LAQALFTQQHHLRRVHRAMADPGSGRPFSDTEIKRLTDAFNHFDKGQRGFIPFSEFDALWRCIGQNPTEAELKIIKDAKDERGVFDLPTFLDICENPLFMKETLKPDHLTEAFRTFDKDGTGKMSVPQLRYMLQYLGDPLDEAEADKFVEDAIAQADKEGTGEIDYEVLVEWLFKEKDHQV